MAQENEQKNISFEDVWGRRESANIISGKISTPLCLGFLSVCNNEKDNARNLIHIMQAMASHRLNEELLLLLEVICDIADMDYDAFQRAKDKPSFKAKHEAELVIFEAARSTLLAMQGDEKLPSLKTLQAEQQRFLDEQQRLYDERAKLKKEARIIDTMKANVDDFLKPVSEREQEQKRNNQIE